MAKRQKTQIYDVIIIGAGISGIGAGIKLIEQDNNNFLILEKHDGLGGTWRDNTYPGCECDVPSALYSYSFAQNPDWTKTFARQEEMLNYVRQTAESFGVVPFVRFNTEVNKLSWNSSLSLWLIESSAGSYYANKVISSVGYLHEPILPNIPGLDDFKGEVFHSSRWDHSLDLRGKRVAVIGTGASAIQFVPEIQQQVDQLFLFQRTPQWIMPKPDSSISERGRNFFKLPFALSQWRRMLYSSFESFGIGFRKPLLLKGLSRIARAHINHYIKDESLREKLTPNYTLGCKRMLLSNSYYPAVAKDNVDLLATGVSEIKGNTVIGANGEEREVDVIILGTGFYVSDVPIASKVYGQEGKSLDEVWQGSPQAYKGTTISGFPNFFLILGPNLAIGHNSAFIVIEAQLRYIMSAIQYMQKNALDTIDVKEDEQKKFNEKVQQDLQTTVWNTGGCSSYYIDENGKNSIGFPWSTFEMKRLLNKYDTHAYTEQSNKDEQEVA